MQTQWTRGFSGHAMGLRYEALPVVAGALGIDLDAMCFHLVGSLERRMIVHWAQRRDADKPPSSPAPRTQPKRQKWAASRMRRRRY